MTSKTGLIASQRKKVVRNKKPVDYTNILLSCALTKNVQFSLRPFGGLYNPYSRGCSILCNHPAALEIKSVVKQAKEAWIAEGKSILHRDNVSANRRDQEDDQQTNSMKFNEYCDLPEHVPEEFFRRYTDTDSRPLTPTPTVCSGRTRTSAGNSLFNTRRCVTPEPPSSHTKERKQLILDLRRSHSQETLYWNASSELSPGPTQENIIHSSNARTTKVSDTKKSAEKNRPEPELITKQPSLICINAREDLEGEDDAPRRRGKKRKKTKQPSVVQTFQPSQDPETQVATLGPDSPNLSTRPSLIPNAAELLPLQSQFEKMKTSENMGRSSCFLDEDSLKILRRGLNLDVVENVFDRYMNRALKEAYRTLPPNKINYESEAVRNLKETLQIPVVDHEKWIKLPRKYSRADNRFELPIDSREFNDMTAIKYLSQYVIVSNKLKQQYRRIFLKNLPEEIEEEKPKIDDTDNESPRIDSEKIRQPIKSDLDKIRTLPLPVFNKALQEVLGFHGTIEKIQEIKEILAIDTKSDQNYIDFRLWCGIVAFSERFITKINRNLDPCNEVCLNLK